MIIDLDSNSCPSTFKCDVAVIGGGAVGLTMAAELSRRGVDVLLLEGGGLGVELAYQELNATTFAQRRMSGMENARFRLLGGTTHFWGGQIYRFDASIFEPRPWLEAEGWPVSRAHLEPYYDRTANLLGLSDDFSDAEIWASVREEPINLGEHVELFLTRTLTNRCTSHIFKDDLQGPSLRAVVHASVTSLSANESGERITGATIASLAGNRATVSANRFVLACGTVENIRLLLHPLEGMRTAPWSTNPWLGRGFNDHIQAVAGAVKITDKRRFHSKFDNIYSRRVKYLPRIKLTPEAQKSSEMLEVAGVFEFRSALREDLANFKLLIRSLMSGRRPENLGKLPQYARGLWKVAAPLAVRYLSSKRGFNPADGGVDLVLLSEQWPNRASSIALSPERDQLGMSRIVVDWQLDGRELASMARFAEYVDEALQQTNVGWLQIDERLRARDPGFLDAAQDYYHHLGGARMGDSWSSGVVDQNLRVRGTSNLYVAGAAVFPEPGFGNPTYTAMALGVRLVDHLRQETT